VTIDPNTHITQALFRYGQWVLAESFFSFFFIRIISKILADGKIEKKERFALMVSLMFFALATYCTYTIWMSYLESINAITYKTSATSWIPTVEQKVVTMNRVVFYNVWCTPFLNVLAAILAYAKKKFGDDFFAIMESSNKKKKSNKDLEDLKKMSPEERMRHLHDKISKNEENPSRSSTEEQLRKDIERLETSIKKNPEGTSVGILKKSLEKKREELAREEAKRKK